MKLDYFTIELSGSVRLGFPLNNLVKVIEIKPKDLYLMPGMAPFWLGIINYQGALLWVLDSHQFFNLSFVEHKPQTTLTAVILQKQLEKSQRRVAFTVKCLKGIITLEKPDFLSLASSLPSAYQELIKGTILGEDQDIDILDLEKFFSFIQNANSMDYFTKNIPKTGEILC
ncbi:CheW protein [Rippkaea orientalis PCC 8801]|uniref:CheW protein n=1 Tax=Rippkaea orientalis (strain PCC 8801 / RF-1) TaxID=41431 RepID=B7JV76_RIPO1|nr:chemotaxis protein CheW [Rippkaea orientalis]ACK68209.1 CheW protein [Rippkaea orientalis PCC 8801]